VFSVSPADPPSTPLPPTIFVLFFSPRCPSLSAYPSVTSLPRPELSVITLVDLPLPFVVLPHRRCSGLPSSSDRIPSPLYKMHWVGFPVSLYALFVPLFGDFQPFVPLLSPQLSSFDSSKNLFLCPFFHVVRSPGFYARPPHLIRRSFLLISFRIPRMVSLTLPSSSPLRTPTFSTLALTQPFITLPFCPSFLSRYRPAFLFYSPVVVLNVPGLLKLPLHPPSYIQRLAFRVFFRFP